LVSSLSDFELFPERVGFMLELVGFILELFLGIPPSFFPG